MRSLWRTLALRWLGGDGSDALTGDLAILEGLLLAGKRPQTGPFDVRRDSLVSRRAIMVPDADRPFDAEIGPQEVLRPETSSRYSR
jgi:hypothetical protein